MLCLFDIDGTLLLKASREHRDALHDAVREVYGVTDPAAVRVPAAGRTDGEIAREILLLSGLAAERIEAGADDFRAACARAYARRVPADLSATVAPGVVDVLSALSERRDTHLALVTGNLEPVARLKLERAGLGGFFARGQGAFGSDSDDRAELPPLARRRAGALDGGEAYPRERTVVIGDTPADIACAHADGLRCVAVATGPYPAAALGAADAVLGSAHELFDVL